MPLALPHASQTTDVPDCLTPVIPKGTKVTESDLHIDSFQVSAECLPGFVGEPRSERCEHPGELYSIKGCTWGRSTASQGPMAKCRS